MLDFKGGFVARTGAFQQNSAKKAKNDEFSCCKFPHIVLFYWHHDYRYYTQEGC